MEKQALNYLNTPTGKKRLIPFLRWAEEITTGSPADLKPVAKRAVALNFANANANAHPHPIKYFIKFAREINKLPSIFQNINLQELIHKLEQLEGKILKKNLSAQDEETFFQTLIKTWLETFHLTFEMVNLSGQEVEEIDKKYSYIYWLMLQCQEAAARVTSKTWEGIEDRMFRVVEK